MLVIGINSICKWLQITSGGRRYTCNTYEVDGELFFYFKKQLHRVADYLAENVEELYEAGGKTLSRKYIP